MNTINPPHTALHDLIQDATQTLIEHVDELTALDQAIGDGDHGLNMKRGSSAIQAQLPELASSSLNEALKAMGKTCIAMIGGSSGPVFGTLLITLGKELAEQPKPHDVAQALRLGLDALTRLGKAEVGQKTLLDVLDPVQKLLAAAPNAVSAQLLSSVAQCAKDSAQATADMDAARGRSSFLGDRAKGHVDPGSRSMALIIGSVCNSLSK